MDQFIRTRSTGTPSELAHKLGISQSQLFNVLNYLKADLNAPIRYSKTARSYIYTEDVRFVCAFLSNTEKF
jgi:ribosomal protein S25